MIYFTTLSSLWTRAVLRNTKTIESPAHILPDAAETFGHKVALITDDARLSFAELEARSNQLANALVGMGIQPGDRVPVHSPNCREWVASYHGVLKTGAVVNPVNVMLTPEEVEFVANSPELLL